MYKITFCSLAIAMTVTTTPATAQGMIESDMFGQSPVSIPVTAPPPEAGRKAITNNVSNTAVAAQASSIGNKAPQAAQEAQLTNWHSAPSEFQKFISDSLGTILPVFGEEFFTNVPSTFAPIANSPVPADYTLGPGDELLIRGWGTIDIDYRATIDRNGTISIPSIGSVSLAGVKARNVEKIIENAVGGLYKGVTVSVNFGQLRAITIYVVGQARRPGTYTVSSLSTLVTTLFASGGPNSNGSMRRVQVKRGDQVVAELDLYDFIAKGNRSADIKLQDGDSVYIPPAGGFVALVGKVNKPAIYELKTDDDTIESILSFGGGLPVVADPRRAFLERINPDRNRPRSVEEFALDSDGLRRSLKNGDVLNVNPITPEFSNAVVLRGNVAQSIRAPFKAGMRISDLVPNKEILITRNSVRRQNNTVAVGKADQDTGENVSSIAQSIGGLIDQINWDYAVVERINRKDLSVKLIPFNLGNIFSNPSGQDNIALESGDIITIFSHQDVAVPMAKRRVFVRVEGEINVPGIYQMMAGDTLQTLLAKAGGTTVNAYLFGTAFYREQARKEQQANLEKIATKLETQLRNEQSEVLANIRASNAADAEAQLLQRTAQAQVAKESIERLRRLKPTGRVAFGLDPKEQSFARLPQIRLEDGDRLVVPAKPAFVHIFGAVNAESSPLWRPNSRLKDYLQVAGITASADTDNIFVVRIDGTVVSNNGRGWFSGGIGGVEVMPGDAIVVPEKIDRTSTWTKFTQGTREWAQIFANFGLGAAAIKTLRD